MSWNGRAQQRKKIEKKKQKCLRRVNNFNEKVKKFELKRPFRYLLRLNLAFYLNCAYAICEHVQRWTQALTFAKVTAAGVSPRVWVTLACSVTHWLKTVGSLCHWESLPLCWVHVLKNTYSSLCVSERLSASGCSWSPGHSPCVWYQLQGGGVSVSPPNHVCGPCHNSP